MDKLLQLLTEGDARLGSYLAIATTVRSVTGEAFLAGGALRDLDSDRPVKDVDIFVPSSAVVLDVEAALAKHFGGATRLSHTAFTSCDGMRDVLSSTNFLVGPQEIQVNLVVLMGTPTLAHVLYRMDFGLCQIGHDGTKTVWTDEYAADVANQTLTITRKDCEESYERTLRRHERLSQKYPGWRLVDPFAGAAA